MQREMFTIALRLMLAVLCVLFSPLVGYSDSGGEKAAESAGEGKIKFRLDNIRADGLRGPADGLVAVSYEFCVPADAAVYAEVKRLDPSVQITPGGRGRVGCQAAGQALCLGNTHQADWRGILRTSPPWAT
jgi:hypothetical protein